MVNSYNIKLQEYKIPKLDLDSQFNLFQEAEEEDKKKKRVPIPQSRKREVYIRSGGNCETCGLNFAKEGIIEEYHHKNGDPSNNEANNITSLCPNCHSKETLKQFIAKQNDKSKERKKIEKKSIKSKHTKNQNNIFGFDPNNILKGLS
jgi:5-methylcytosine-specific restriction endonuclease McrA